MTGAPRELCAAVEIERCKAITDHLCDGVKRLPSNYLRRRFLASMLEMHPDWQIEIAAVYTVAGLTREAANAR